MTNYDIEGIAEGAVEVDTSAMSPMEALQVGLAVQDYKEENDISEREFKIDYDAVGEYLRGNQP
ncbi:hypothetical protein [Sporosarcina sp. BP05]|uniref:hypothetical protein n=1 Tax=Sporosarcina sp. BP05 TaxID=2758726 RepID=UPI0016465503|nr:hypothetical protein [Sporosarcina sp. BP05]